MTKIFTYIPLINYTEDSNFFLDLYKLKNDFDYSYFFSEENLPIKTSFWFLRPYTSPQQLKQFFETRTSDILKFFLISSRTDHSFRESDFKNFSTKIFLEAFEYDWEKHQEILNLGFLPILVPSPDEQNQDLTFIFWRKFPTSFTVTQEGPLKDQKIYSYYPKGVFNKFYPYLLNNKQNNSFKIYNKNYFAMNSSSLVSSRRNNNSYRSNNFSDDTTDPVTQLYCRKYGDVTFFGQDLSSLSELLEDYFDTKKIFVLEAPGWKTSTNSTEISFKKYTHKQFLSRRTSFASVVYQTNVLLAKDTISTINYFSLVSSASHLDLNSYSRSNNVFVKVFKSLSRNEGLAILDPEKLLEYFNQNYGHLNLYNNKSFFNTSIEFLTELNRIVSNYNFQEEEKLFSSKQNTLLTTLPKIDSGLNKKFNRINTSFSNHLKNFNFNFNPYNMRSSASHTKDLFSRLQKSKNQTNHLIFDCIINLKKLKDSALYIQKNKPIFLRFKNSYEQAYQEALENQNYHSDNFFNNLLADKIKILSVHYEKDNSSYSLNPESSLSSFKDFSLSLKDTSVSITEINFLIDRPVQIKIDGSLTNSIAAGPYIVRVKKNSIELKLKNPLALAAQINESSFALHPHTNTSSFNSLYTRFKSGCLGEASSLIWNAFDKSDLKLIILSAMTWITSANSTDVWGKKYHHFTLWKDIDDTFESLESDEVTSSDVNSFLQNSFEEEEEDEQEAPQEAPTQEEPATVEIFEPPVTEEHDQPQFTSQDFISPQTNYTNYFGRS